jgi:hypothetical protein
MHALQPRTAGKSIPAAHAGTERRRLNVIEIK